MTDDSDDVWSSHETTVSPEEVARARKEAASDEVVCYECARSLGQINAQHLQTHRMTLDEYRAVHPEAAIYPDDPARQPGREPGFSHTAETKRKISEELRQAPDGGEEQ